MTDLKALLEAIRANPEEDHLRLIYADALEESGDADRAKFIRRHIARFRHQVPNVPQGRGYSEFYKGYLPHESFFYTNPTSYTLEDHHGASALFWSRGFVEHVFMTQHEWCEIGDKIYDENPVQRVEFPPTKDDEPTWTPTLMGADIRIGRKELYKVADRIVELTEEDMKRFIYSPRRAWELPETLFPETTMGCVLFEKRWPGVKFSHYEEPANAARP